MPRCQAYLSFTGLLNGKTFEMFNIGIQVRIVCLESAIAPPFPRIGYSASLSDSSHSGTKQWSLPVTELSLLWQETWFLETDIFKSKHDPAADLGTIIFFLFLLAQFLIGSVWLEMCINSTDQVANIPTSLSHQVPSIQYQTKTESS